MTRLGPGCKDCIGVESEKLTISWRIGEMLNSFGLHELFVQARRSHIE